METDTQILLYVNKDQVDNIQKFVDSIDQCSVRAVNNKEKTLTVKTTTVCMKEVIKYPKNQVGPTIEIDSDVRKYIGKTVICNKDLVYDCKISRSYVIPVHFEQYSLEKENK